MTENKIDNLLVQIDIQLDMLYQDFTTAQTEKVQFELDHARGYSEDEKTKLNQLNFKESFIYDQIYLFNEIKTQLELWKTVRDILNNNEN